jgi:glycosyltransferase involved in cell wall biosynthesis
MRQVSLLGYHHPKSLYRGVVMRVLWFLDSEPPAVRQHLGQTALNEAAWHGGLLDTLAGRDDVELHVGCHAAEAFEPFDANGVYYYEIGRRHPQTGTERVAQRWLELTEPSVDLRRCRELVRRTDPSVVHVHGTESALGLLAESSPHPLVVSIQGLLTVCRLMDRRGLDSYLRRSLSPGAFLRGSGYVFQRLELRHWSARERRILAACRHVIGRTRFDEDVVGVLNSQAVYHHCDEVLRPAFRQRRWEAADAVPGRVFSTVREYARKGVGTLLEATALLRDAHATRLAPGHVHLRVAGDLSQEGRHAVRRAVRALGLKDRVAFLGGLGPGQLAEELARAAAFALPSHVDNSPNSLAEAMVLGVPCVASAVGGVPSLARDGTDGLLVQDGDPYALAGALGRVLTDPELAAGLSTAASARARQRHDPDTVRRRLLDIYRLVAEDI